MEEKEGSPSKEVTIRFGTIFSVSYTRDPRGEETAIVIDVGRGNWFDSIQLVEKSELPLPSGRRVVPRSTGLEDIREITGQMKPEEMKNYVRKVVERL